jgi:hypothetical protein
LQHRLSETLPQQQPGLKSIIGTDQALRAQFATQGSGFSLTSDLAASFGKVDSGGKFPVFAHALDLGEVQTIPSVAWAVGVIRDPVITYSGVPRRSYFWSRYPTIGDGVCLISTLLHLSGLTTLCFQIDAFISDFPAARTRAVALDQTIVRDASAVSQNYADLVSLATRQAMAGIEITLSTTASGEWNFSDAQAFMKDVGNSQCVCSTLHHSQLILLLLRRVNPTETIYAALPALMYLNTSISGLLIEPLLRFQSSSSYHAPQAASDLGEREGLEPHKCGSIDSTSREFVPARSR